MIDSFGINGYKVFQSLAIRKLERLNLFVGENNAGKSCLLEAIRLWSGGGTLPLLREVILSRSLDWEELAFRRRPFRSEPASNAMSSELRSEDPLQALFNYSSKRDGQSPTIELGPLSGEEMLRISLGKYATIKAEDGTDRRIRINEQLTLDNIEDDSELMLEIDSSGKRRVFGLDTFWLRRPGFRLNSSSEESGIRPISMVGTNGLTSAQAAILWDQVSLLPHEGKVLKCLQLIEPAIEGLTFVGDIDGSTERSRIPVVTLRGRRGRFPLKSMGDGLTRLFHIALAMVNAQNGTVLIDEFENGIYWEVQQQLWPLIFEMAVDFNVQVFATSHSKDCLSSFMEAAEMNFGLGGVFRVERSPLGTRILPLPLLNVADALAAQVEIR